MQIKKKYLQRYLHDIAVEQIAEEYQEKGYVVSRKQPLGGYEADIVAKKDNENIVIEVKSGKMSPARKEAIIQIGNYIKDRDNYKFLVVIATPPKDKKLEVEEIESLLSGYLSENPPQELIELSSNTTITRISDVDIDEITVSEDHIFVTGDGVVDVDLNWGSTSDKQKDNGFALSENFPFSFGLTLKYDEHNLLQIHKVNQLAVDLSYYLTEEGEV
jgi:hypothetical protein